MTRNKSFLTDYQKIDGGFVAFGGSPKGGKISGTVLLKVPRQNNMYSFDLKNVVPSGDHLGKFEGKADKEFLVGYFVNSKAFRVFNSRTRRVKENLHIKFLENKSNVAGRAGQEKASDHEHILLPFMPLSTQSLDDKDVGDVPNKGDEGVSKESGIDNQEKTYSSIRDVDTTKPSINTASTNINTGSLNINIVGFNDPSMPSLEETGIYDDVYDDRKVGAEADTNNLELSTVVSPILTTRVHKDHPKEQIIRDLNLATQTRRMLNFSKENDMVFRNKKDEKGIIITKKARMVAQGYTQEESIDYDEVFANVARIEAIRIFLAYSLFMGFIVYQMDVKSAFLYGTIEKELYVCQPPSFEDPHFPNKVYKVEKALYGLHQALRAWYETSSTYLLKNRFRKGLQVKQNDDGIFISQDKYVADILKKFYLTTVKITSIPMEPNKTLIKDAEAKDVDVRLYRSMIESLMYLTASKPDIMFAVCACARFQVTPKTSHLHAVKRIFKYLKGQPKLGLWYPRDSPFDLEAFFESTTGVSPTIYTSCIKQFWTSAKDKTVNDDVRIQTLVDGKKVVVNEASIRRDLRLDDAEGTACLPNADIFEELARMGTMAFAIIFLANNQKFNFSKYILENMVKNLEAEVKFFMFPRFIKVLVNHQTGDMSHHKGIFLNPSLTKKVFANIKRVGIGFSRVITPLFETMMVQAPEEVGDIPTDTQDTPILTQPSTSQPQKKHKPRRKQRKETDVSQDEPPTEEHITIASHDPLPSGENRLQLNELMEICTKLSNRVLSLEQINTNQAAKIKKLKKIVKKLEGKKKKRTHGLKRLYKIGLSSRIVSSDKEGLGDQEDVSKQERIAEIDVDKDLSLINETAQDQGRINDQDLFGVHDLDGDEVFVDVTTRKNVEHDATIAKKVVTTIEDIEVTAVAATTPQISKDEFTLAQTLMEIKAAKPKEKGVTIQEPSEFRTTSLSQPPQTKYKEVVRKLEAEMKAKMDEEERLAREKNEANIDVIKERHDVYATIDADKRKYFAAKRAEEIRNKPPIKKLDEQVQAKVADDDTTELKRCLEIVPEDDDDVTIKATPISCKSPTIVDYKIYKEWKKSYFKIIRADGNSQNYLTFGTMFKNFNREDLEVLRSIVKERFKKIKPIDDIDNLLF
nr:retrovirus-related Pol polyprotein from transposon TNT 1-94 [Tanacetum cinerariifolium]